MANQDPNREHRSLSENRKMAQELHNGVHLNEAVSILKAPKASVAHFPRAPKAYEVFKNKLEGCTKVVIKN